MENTQQNIFKTKKVIENDSNDPSWHILIHYALVYTQIICNKKTDEE